MKSANVQTLVIHFGTHIPFSNLPAFRGSIIAASRGHNVLFHNHVGDGFRYSYPLIQYKQIKGKAAIVCIGVNGNCECSDFGKIECSVLSNKSTSFSVTTMQHYW